MSITLVPCNTRCLNMGDVAMLQVAVRRLRALWPEERLLVFTSDAAALRRYCPEVEPAPLPDQPPWTKDRYIAGRLHAWAPAAISNLLVRGRVAIACRAPWLHERLLRARAWFERDDRASLGRFLGTIAGSRLVVITGAGGVADHFRDYSQLTLLALQAARLRGIPTAMMGHGFGPLTLPDLRRKAAAVLPRVDFIAIREHRASLPLLTALGVSPERVLVTGDDAIALAYEARVPVIGQAIGINLRIARSSAVTQEDIADVRAGLRRFLARQPALLLGLPIARQHDLDLTVIRELLRPERRALHLVSRTDPLRRRASDHGFHTASGVGASSRGGDAAGAAEPLRASGTTPPGSSMTGAAATGAAATGAARSPGGSAVATDSGEFPLPFYRREQPAVISPAEAAASAAADPLLADGRELDTPLAVIAQTSRCRIVVTGAYHAAVFALAQGVPAVCLARSRYFRDKFAGLASLFGVGCLLVSLDEPDLPARLAAAMTLAWDQAPGAREALCAAALRQITAGEAAYARLRRLGDGVRLPDGGADSLPPVRPRR